METVVHDIRDLNDCTRSAAEQLVGHPLNEDQRLVIQVVSVVPVGPETAESKKERSAAVPDWWNIYEGLSDEEIERLDRAINQRANLTRTFD